MTKKKQRAAEQEKEELNRRALELLQSPLFWDLYSDALQRTGLVGEDRNADILLVTAISRLLDRPLNIIVKGQSASGKNHAVSRVLRLVPEDAVLELTSSSAKAWNYAGDDLRHRIVYLQERNEASGAVHPARLLISEGRLIHTVTVNRKTERYVAEGPIASISTTTKDKLEIDDETRNLSIWIDESPEQTKRIKIASTVDVTPLSQDELAIWHAAHRLLEARAKLPVVLPAWFQQIAAYSSDDVRARRYFPAFVTACKAIALLRSFEPKRDQEIHKNKRIEVDLADFAIASILFDPAFVESLHHNDDETQITRSAVARITRQNGGKSVDATDLATELNVSPDKAYTLLRIAEERGVIFRANKPEKTNHKLYLPSPKFRFLPSLEECEMLLDIDDYARFIHPLTGEWIDFTCNKKKKAG